MAYNGPPPPRPTAPSIKSTCGRCWGSGYRYPLLMRWMLYAASELLDPLFDADLLRYLSFDSCDGCHGEGLVSHPKPAPPMGSGMSIEREVDKEWAKFKDELKDYRERYSSHGYGIAYPTPTDWAILEPIVNKARSLRDDVSYLGNYASNQLGEAMSPQHTAGLQNMYGDSYHPDGSKVQHTPTTQEGWM